MVSLTISTKGKPKVSVDFPDRHPEQVTVKQLHQAVHAKFPVLVPNRQRLTISKGEGKPTPLTDESKSLASYGVGDKAELRLKDLGKQVPYRYLYLWEYAGPIFINPLFLKLSHHIWGAYTPSALQIAIRNIIVLHFIKRWLESAFVHSFSRSTLPLAYVYRNSAYYWGVVGVLCGLTLYRPAYSAEALKGSILNNPAWVGFWSLFILCAELLNLNAHVHLASLRQPAGQPRKYPTGLGFGTVVCANYWFETLGVFAMSIMTGFDIGTVVYSVIATMFMHRWAAGKYARYKREFDPKVFPGRRWKWFPPFS
ncbi:uncharacterized protein MKK02DRAFT_42036 [Dioszegia hungarica]|uniref:3-oxo-5-alpha-steroid 4-dehydrogenase C-terminal domain-containing protein n=1 Tax=Dioszegia hungarica TaxID=4972 RepID=A0AA38HEA9_9TREE|nr:uncharacterized protein MKK02DRAFT_42036 [Dioszegia hungarica]KAI9639003.1 hypothetical protein MKK02DRAFT_42036 [Dioszegia hungarica]